MRHISQTWHEASHGRRDHGAEKNAVSHLHARKIDLLAATSVVGATGRRPRSRSTSGTRSGARPNTSTRRRSSSTSSTRKPEDPGPVQVRPWANWYQTYSTAIAAGTAPDVSTGAGYQAIQFRRHGRHQADERRHHRSSRPQRHRGFRARIRREAEGGKRLLALPWNVDIRVWFYNKEMFDAANLTPDELVGVEGCREGADQGRQVRPGLVRRRGGSHYIYSLRPEQWRRSLQREARADLQHGPQP